MTAVMPASSKVDCEPRARPTEAPLHPYPHHLQTKISQFVPMASLACVGDVGICVRFERVGASECELKDILRGVVAHFKGFTYGLQHSPPLELLDYLLSCDVIVFDGDSFKPDAYTCVLPILVALAHTRHVRIPDFLAFKYASAATSLKSWNASFSVALQPCFGCRVLTEDEISDTHAKVQVVLVDDTHALRGPGHVIDHSDKYLKLGVHALCTTAAKIVVCLGGGATLKAEFAADDERGAVWHVFDATRLTKVGEMEHCSLIGKDSPRIVHHASA